jgi:hypothetical protein
MRKFSKRIENDPPTNTDSCYEKHYPGFSQNYKKILALKTFKKILYNHTAICDQLMISVAITCHFL